MPGRFSFANRFNLIAASVFNARIRGLFLPKDTTSTLANIKRSMAGARCRPTLHAVVFEALRIFKPEIV
jgi:hypothetical protein